MRGARPCLLSIEQGTLLSMGSEPSCNHKSRLVIVPLYGGGGICGKDIFRGCLGGCVLRQLGKYRQLPNGCAVSKLNSSGHRKRLPSTHLEGISQSQIRGRVCPLGTPNLVRTKAYGGESPLDRCAHEGTRFYGSYRQALPWMQIFSRRRQGHI